MERPGLSKRRCVLAQVLPRPEVVIALQEPDVSSVHSSERSHEVLHGVLGILEHRALELLPGALRPPRRLREVHDVTDVYDLGRLVLPDEVDDCRHRFLILVRCLRIADHHD